jgi:class 3 adenylate cyclase
MEPQIKYALTEDGVSVGYWTIGEGKPFVWPPGAVGSPSLRAWLTLEGRALFERVAAHRMVVRYDSRGFGTSQEVTMDLSLEARVRDLAAVVERLGTERVDLCGYLDSGPAVLAYAASHPERISHLVLWSTTRRGVAFFEDDLQRLLNELAKVDFEIWREASVATVARSLGVAHDYASTLLGWLTPETGPQFFDSLRIDVTDVLAHIQAPTLILHRRGIKRPRMADVQETAARIPNVRLTLLEGDASLPYMGDWEAVVMEIEDFLDAGSDAHPRFARPASGGLVTVLFTDLVGHTEMMQRLGDAKGRDVLRDHERITREVITHHNGTEIKTDGDSFMVSFGSAAASLECAIALQRAFAQRNERAAELLHVRMGLNAGEPIEEDGDLFGATVILASRIAARAEAGEILVPDTVRGLLSGKGYVFGDRGEFVPKGFDEGVRLWDVRWQE